MLSGLGCTETCIGQGGVHVDSQFDADSASSPGTNGNHRANAGEYIRYSMVVRNTGKRDAIRHAPD